MIAAALNVGFLAVTLALLLNLYRLAREVWGIGFKTADKIAKAVGIAHDAPERRRRGCWC